jgi:hypothetical protein
LNQRALLNILESKKGSAVDQREIIHINEILIGHMDSSNRINESCEVFSGLGDLGFSSGESLNLQTRYEIQKDELQRLQYRKRYIQEECSLLREKIVEQTLELERFRDNDSYTSIRPPVVEKSRYDKVLKEIGIIQGENEALKGENTDLQEGRAFLENKCLDIQEMNSEMLDEKKEQEDKILSLQKCLDGLEASLLFDATISLDDFKKILGEHKLAETNVP